MGNYDRRSHTHHKLLRGDVCEFFIKGETRHCLIVSNNYCNTFADIITIVPLSTRFKRPDLRTHAFVYVGREKLMASCEHVTTIKQENIVARIGRVGDKDMEKIDAACCVALGIGERKWIL